jgi:hypothetical protein
MGAIKTSKALRKASIGVNPGSASAMLALIPARIQDRLPASDLAQLVDAIWRACQASKSIAAAEILDEGAIWDARKQRLVELTV